MTGTTQYLRACKIIIADSSGEGLDVSLLKVQFYIQRGDIQTPNSCDLRIFNLSDNTANRIQNEFTQVVVMAGYGDFLGRIFRGTIVQVRKGRLDAKNSYLDVTAADGDEAYNFAPVNTSFTNANPGGIASFLAQQLASKGVSQGYMPELSSNTPLRGRVFYGMCKDHLRTFADENKCSWSIQDGQFTLIPLTSFIPGHAVVISPSTGLVGVPEQTQQGISIRVLLNSNIKIGRTVQLVDTTINQLRLGLSIDQQRNNLAAQSRQLKLNDQGLYYVMRALHHGDTRGNYWYTDMICLAVDATVPTNLAPDALIAADAGSIPRFTH